MSRASELKALAKELTEDPENIDYRSMTAAEAEESLNEANRNGPGDIEAMRKYLLTEKYFSNTGSDTTPTQLLGRIRALADAQIPTWDDSSPPVFSLAVVNCFGSTDTLEMKHVHAALAFEGILLSAESALAIDFEASGFNDLLNDLRTGKAIGAADKTAIQAMSQNTQSRAQELGLGRVTAAKVLKARAL